MRKNILKVSLIVLMSSLATAMQGQIVVWSQNFDSETPGEYGAHLQDFGSVPAANPDLQIVSPGKGGTGQAYSFTFDVTAGTGNDINVQGATLEYPTTGNNTNSYLANYWIEFDMAIQGQTMGFASIEVGIFGPSSWIFNGDALKYELFPSNVPTAGSGYQHFSIPLDKFSPSGNNGNTSLDPTDSAMSVGFGAIGYPPSITASPETILVDNIQILLTNHPVTIVRPTMHEVPAKPGLRIFAQNYSQLYNQEGFGTVDSSQSWIGATAASPRKYSVTFQDFDTVDGYTFFSQFVQNSGGVVNPYIVFVNPNALTWRIVHQATGFTSLVDWKTNAANFTPGSNVLTMVTTSTNGRGTWTLTFSNNTDGTVTAPDGTKGSFSLPAGLDAQFADPMTICFGTAPSADVAGFGQWLTLSSVTITNVNGVNESDDFTKDALLNTNLWDPAFSLDPGSVIQVSTNTPYWVNWTIPDPQFGLGTKADLHNTSIPWHRPDYYSGGAVTLNPVQMGPSLKWVLIPKSCLPTTDGTTNGPVSSKGFFILSNPAPTQ